jgi:type II secretory pathway component PulF
MPTFLYRAKRGPDEPVDGEIEADSRAAALVRLDALGLSPVWVRPRPESAAPGRRRRLLSRRVRARDVTVFTLQLASLVRSAVPILRALRTVAQQSGHPAMGHVAGDIEAAVRDGRMLSEALERHPSLFPPLYVGMVRAGESAGALDVTLARLAESREREEDLRRRIQAAVAYPVLILAVGFLTVVALFAFFLPRVVSLFRGYAALPLPTRILIALSDSFSAYGLWLLVGLVLAVAVLRRIAAVERARLFFDTLKLRLPLAGRFWAEGDLARYARTLALLIEAGVPIDRALESSAGALRNEALRAELDKARDRTVRQGSPFSESLRLCPHVPLFLINLAAVGEESGRLPEALTEAAVFYEKEVEQRARLLSSLLEPALILAVGSVVGFIVAAMLLPIFELSSSVR